MKCLLCQGGKLLPPGWKCNVCGLEYASYGKDKALGSDVNKLTDVAYEAIYDYLSR